MQVKGRPEGELCRAVEAVFERHGEGGAVLEVPPGVGSGGPVLVKAYLPLGAGGRRRRRSLEKSLRDLGSHDRISPPRCRELQEKDWAEAWKEGYGIRRVGRRWVIVPSWENYAPRPDEIVIRLDPGMAFGTGQHATTRLCLELMEEYLGPGAGVLDLGTGTGILAIAALRLGAARVVALDTDPQAVASARRNAALNGVERHLELREGTLQDLGRRSGEFRLIAANLLADTLIALLPALARHLSPVGVLIVSGILAEQAGAVETAIGAHGLRPLEARSRGPWTAIAVRALEEG